MSENKKVSEFKVLIAYNQLCVFYSSLDNPFNDWTTTHVAQGFSWRKESVSFGTQFNEETFLEIVNVLEFNADNLSTRAIGVPFSIPPNENIVVGSIGDEKEISITQGDYKLWFEILVRQEQPRLRLTFVPEIGARPEIQKADSDIVQRNDFLMEAHPAI